MKAPLRVVLRLAGYLWGWFADIILLVFSRKAIRPPNSMPINNELLRLSATQLAEQLRARKITSVQLVQAYIDRIKQVNPYLNAVVATRFEEALEEARAADALLQSGKYDPKKQPFLGVPCTLKECFMVKGMPNTSGLVARKALGAAPRDAPVVVRMKNAGFIPLGVTNTPEICMWYETHNHVNGLTCNAYNLDHMVGGSSGGEGAIIGAGASLLGLGSDIGGSIRMPAYFNGVFGHKPTAGIVESTDQHPPLIGEAAKYGVSGPICRYATDLYPTLRVMATEPDKLVDPATVDLSRVRVLYTEDFDIPLVSSVHPDIRRTVREVAAYLHNQLNMREHTRVQFEGFGDAFNIWSAMVYEAVPHRFAYLMGNETNDFKPWRELWQFIRGKRQYTLPGILYAIVDPLVPTYVPKAHQAALVAGRKLREELHKTLGNDGVLIVPTHPVAAPKHAWAFFHPFNVAYTGIFNVMEVPCTSVPTGLNRHGLPIGVQIVAGPGNDALCLRIAQELERKYGGWVEPTFK